MSDPSEFGVRSQPGQIFLHAVILQVHPSHNTSNSGVCISQSQQPVCFCKGLLCLDGNRTIQPEWLLQHRKVSGLFTTPKLLEALADQVNLWDAGIRGVFCGGTSMKPQEVRFIVEELLEGRIGFYPTYGNTLMGLAASVPLQPEDNFSVTYYAPQPRAVLRVVKPNATQELVNYGEFGRVELTTLTREFFMPRFLERDEAIRRAPRPPYAWDGVGDVRPFGAMEKTIVEGVY